MSVFTRTTRSEPAGAMSAANIQRLGGSAALTQTLLLIVVMSMFGFVLPRQGFTPDQFTDFTKVVPIIPSFDVVNSVAIVRGFDFVLLALALFQRSAALAPHRMLLVLVGAGMTATLLCAQGMIGLAGWAALLQHPDTQAVAGAAVQAVSQSLIDAAFVTQGVVAILVGWASAETRTLPAALAWLIIAGGVLILIIPAVSMALVPAMVAWLAWTAWLGIELVRQPQIDPLIAGEHA